VSEADPLRSIRKITEVRTEYLSARRIHANLERRVHGDRSHGLARPLRFANEDGKAQGNFCSTRPWFQVTGEWRAEGSSLDGGRTAPSSGYLTAEIDYTTAEGETRTLRVRDYDVRFLDRVASAEALSHLELIHCARRGEATAADELHRRAKDLLARISARFAEHSLVQNEWVIPYTAEGEFTEAAISQKGRVLFDLSRRGFSTADFCLLSSKTYLRPVEERDRCLMDAVRNLEILSGRRLENPDDPLLIAVRSALPEYFPPASRSVRPRAPGAATT